MTLKELFEKHGSVWLAYNNFPGQKGFRPLGYSENRERIIGEDASGYAVWNEPYAIGTLYTEPPKLKRLELLGWVCIDSYYKFSYKSQCPGPMWKPALDANGTQLKLEIFVEEG